MQGQQAEHSKETVKRHRPFASPAYLVFLIPDLFVQQAVRIERSFTRQSRRFIVSARTNWQLTV